MDICALGVDISSFSAVPRGKHFPSNAAKTGFPGPEFIKSPAAAKMRHHSCNLSCFWEKQKNWQARHFRRPRQWILSLFAAAPVGAGPAVPAAAAFILFLSMAHREEKSHGHSQKHQNALQVHILTPIRKSGRRSGQGTPQPRQWRTGWPPSPPPPGRCPFPV